jgi:hypothetical protein
MGMPSLNEFVTRLLDILAKPAASPVSGVIVEGTEPKDIFPPIVEA